MYTPCCIACGRPSLRIRIPNIVVLAVYTYTFNFDMNTVSVQEDDIIIVRTEPDPTSQELPCANQMIMYECRLLIPTFTLTWTLPNKEILTFSILRNINDTEPPDPSDDDNYIATLTNKTEGEVIDTFLFTSTIMILEPVDGSAVTCTGVMALISVSNDTTIILSGRSLLCV